jgi:hypothetical protein
MKQVPRILLGVAALATCAALVFGSAANSSPNLGNSDQAHNAKVERELVGTWRLLSAVLRSPDGEILSYPFGQDAVGKLTYTGGGQVWVKAAAHDDPNGWYTGTFDADASAGTVTHHIQYASNPSAMGTNQLRLYRLAGDRLTLSVPASTPDSPVLELTWQRLDKSR